MTILRMNAFFHSPFEWWLLKYAFLSSPSKVNLKASHLQVKKVKMGIFVLTGKWRQDSKQAHFGYLYYMLFSKSPVGRLPKRVHKRLAAVASKGNRPFGTHLEDFHSFSASQRTSFFLGAPSVLPSLSCTYRMDKWHRPLFLYWA